MRHHEIEAWALRIIDRVTDGHPHEDARVELKSEWPEPKKAARQIAGHANAARSAAILWLIGVNQKSGVVGAPHADLAEWWPAVQSEFDGTAPRLVDLNITAKGKTVTALYLETERPPYVVKNSDGGKIQFEVPWRDGTTTRTADRSELLRILSPLQELPIVEVMSAELMAYKIPPDQNMPAAIKWYLLMRLYIVTKGEEVVIPFHRCAGTFEVPSVIPPTDFDEIEINPPKVRSTGHVLSLTIESTNNEVLIHGPGKAMLETRATTSHSIGNFAQPANIALSLGPAGWDQSITFTQTLSYVSPPYTSTTAGMPPLSAMWVYSIPRYRQAVGRA